jgi:hypothetical protein
MACVLSSPAGPLPQPAARYGNGRAEATKNRFRH